MWLLVGLGNPGDEYAKNRHNVGFMALDAIADELMAPAFKDKFKGQYTEARIGSQKVGLLKPQTYMNESGQSIQAAASFYKIPEDRIIVFYDELDLNPGKVRVRTGGGAAGHNGIRSSVKHLPSPDFIRVRIGIGHPGDRNRVSGYVLGNFSKDDQKWLEKLIPAIANNTRYLLEDKNNDFMTYVAEQSR